MSAQANTDIMEDAASGRERFTIFRRETSPLLQDSHSVDVVLDPVSQDGMERMGAAGIDDGSTLYTLFAAPGMSLTYAWFRSGFPLPRHSHNADCVYYIIAGSLQLGTESLGAGDGFFVPADAPYTYVVGPEGLEILEFRTADKFNIEFLAKNPAYWAKAVETVASRRDAWLKEPRPSQRPAE